MLLYIKLEKGIKRVRRLTKLVSSRKKKKDLYRMNQMLLACIAHRMHAATFNLLANIYIRPLAVGFMQLAS